jgi:chromosome segregation ATPase
LSRVTIGSVAWVRAEELDNVRAEKASAIAQIDWLDGELTRLCAEVGRLNGQVAQLQERLELTSERDENGEMIPDAVVRRDRTIARQEEQIVTLRGMLDQQRRDGAKFLTAYGDLAYKAGKLTETLRSCIPHIADEQPAKKARAVFDEAVAVE